MTDLSQGRDSKFLANMSSKFSVLMENHSNDNKKSHLEGFLTNVKITPTKSGVRNLEHETLCEGLCNDGMPPKFPDLEVVDVDANGKVETCAEIDEMLKTQFPADDEICITWRYGLQPLCCEPSEPFQYCEGLCNDGMPPKFPDKEVGDVNGDGMEETCGEIDEMLKTQFPAEHEVCQRDRYSLQPACCEPSEPFEFCEGLCHQGKAVINPSLQLIDITGDGILNTCHEIDDFIKVIVPEDDEFCLLSRFGLGAYCCEPLTPTETCSGVCVSGEPPLFPDTKISVDVTGDGFANTCSDIDMFAKSLVPKDSDACLVSRLEAQPYCCSDEDRCEGLCPGGEYPINPDLEIDFFALEYAGTPTQTCAEVDSILKTLPDFDDSCAGEDFDEFLEYQLECCGGIEPPEPIITCESLCPYGDSVPPEFLDKEIYDPELDTTFTCGQLELFFPFEAEKDTCDFVQYLGVTECGCYFPPPATVCVDGAPLQEDYYDVVIDFETGSTCQQLNDVMPFIPEEERPQLQLVGYVFCGCDAKPAEYEDSCTVCADGSKISPDQGPDCLGFELGIHLEYTNDDEQCNIINIEGFFNCGCPPPEPPENPCDMCGDKFEIDEDVMVTIGEEAPPMTCGMAAGYAMFIPNDSINCVTGKIATYEQGCCVGDSRCPDKDNSIFNMFLKTNPIRPCSLINRFDEERSYKICNPNSGLSDALFKCPYACKQLCTCKDGKWKKFTITQGKLKGQQKNCFWLSRFKKKKIRNICKRQPEAAETCPNTCEGWCKFKSFP